jgi:hypothetical protein
MKTFKWFLTESQKDTSSQVSGRYLTKAELKSAGKRAKLAKRLGVTFHDINTMTDEELLSVIKNIGEHDFVPDDEFDPVELARGVEVEGEHTRSRLVAKLVAKDHLAEIPDYYTRLDKMEAEGKRENRHK